MGRPPAHAERDERLCRLVRSPLVGRAPASVRYGGLCDDGMKHPAGQRTARADGAYTVREAAVARQCCLGVTPALTGAILK
jgi:hypothetical protein